MILIESQFMFCLLMSLIASKAAAFKENKRQDDCFTLVTRLHLNCLVLLQILRHSISDREFISGHIFRWLFTLILGRIFCSFVYFYFYFYLVFVIGISVADPFVLHVSSSANTWRTSETDQGISLSVICRV